MELLSEPSSFNGVLAKKSTEMCVVMSRPHEIEIGRFLRHAERPNETRAGVVRAGTRGHLDKIPNSEVQTWETEFLKFIHDQKHELFVELKKEKDLTDGIAKQIESAIKEFQAQYASGATKAKKKTEREPVAV